MTRPNLNPVPDGPELPDGPFPVPVTAKGLTIPRLRVTPADGPTYEVQALNPDLLKFEDTATKHRWPGPGTAPFRWLTFLAWSASTRHHLTTLTWEEFAATTAQVENLEGQNTATPTPPGPDPG